ncbi:MAG TPA: hypothetical protein VJ672_09590 [Gemmatimonadaceae bacterium]|nr:hypothetical protein [Gemmatimonadaceae bacterium]
MTTSRVLVAFVLGAAFAACATPGSAPSVDRNFVSQQELEPMATANVYQALQRIRPDFLRKNRGRSSINLQNARTVVYIDDARFEELDALRTILCSQVQSIRYIDGRDAVTRYGSGHEAGAIIVTLKG